MPPKLSRASSSNGLAWSGWPERIAAAAVRDSQSTLSRGGPLLMAFGPSTMILPVKARGGFRFVVAHPVTKRSNPTAMHAEQNDFMSYWPETRRRLAVGGIFQALLLDLGGILPD